MKIARPYDVDLGLYVADAYGICGAVSFNRVSSWLEPHIGTDQLQFCHFGTDQLHTEPQRRIRGQWQALVMPWSGRG